MNHDRSFLLTLIRDATLEKVAGGFTNPVTPNKGQQPALPAPSTTGGPKPVQQAAAAAQHGANQQASINQQMSGVISPPKGRTKGQNVQTALALQPDPKKVVQPDSEKTVVAAVWPWQKSPAVQSAQQNFQQGGTPSQQRVNQQQPTQAMPRIPGPSPLPAPAVGSPGEARPAYAPPPSAKTGPSSSAAIGRAHPIRHALTNPSGLIQRSGRQIGRAAGWALAPVGQAARNMQDQYIGESTMNSLNKYDRSLSRHRSAADSRNPWSTGAMKRRASMGAQAALMLTPVGAALGGGKLVPAALAARTAQLSTRAAQGAGALGRGVVGAASKVGPTGVRLAEGALAGGDRLMGGLTGALGAQRPAMAGGPGHIPYRSPPIQTHAESRATSASSQGTAAPPLTPPPTGGTTPAAAPAPVKAFPEVKKKHLKNLDRIADGSVYGPGLLGRVMGKGGKKIKSYGNTDELNARAAEVGARGPGEQMVRRWAGKLVREETPPVIQTRAGMVGDAKGTVTVPNEIMGVKVPEVLAGRTGTIDEVAQAARDFGARTRGDHPLLSRLPLNDSGRLAKGARHVENFALSMGPQEVMMHPGFKPGAFRNPLSDAINPGNIGVTRVIGKGAGYPVGGYLAADGLHSAGKGLWNSGYMTGIGGPTEGEAAAIRNAGGSEAHEQMKLDRATEDLNMVNAQRYEEGKPDLTMDEFLRGPGGQNAPQGAKP